MKGIIKYYLSNRGNVIKYDVLYNNLLFEENEMVNKDIFYNVYFYNRKRLIAHKLLKKEDLIKERELLLKSSMVVFVVNLQEKRVAINDLKAFCEEWQCYGPIVNMTGNEFFFFPQLRYQDGYLLKNIFEQKYIDENFDVLYGNVII